MKITTIGVDLAKNIFQIHGVDAHEKPVVRRTLKRGEMLPYFANLQPCLIGMEACGSAHYWARKLMAYGHTVKLMAPQFVKPYVKSNKNDARDAEAICEAVARPNMRFVPIKNVEQQAVTSLHRARQGFIKARTAQCNQIRGLLSEYGLIMPPGISHIYKRVPDILEDAENGLPGTMRGLINRLTEHLKELDNQVFALDKEIKQELASNELGKKLTEIPGIGPLTASALVATIGDAKNFASGRELAAWLGLVPKQHSSGGKSVLLGISKRGDTYLRTLLIHGARSVLQYIEGKQDKTSEWAHSLLARRNKNVAAVALANKNARTVWALLTKQSKFRLDYAAEQPTAA
jgi:transposase